jgi:hypothetical protein
VAAEPLGEIEGILVSDIAADLLDAAFRQAQQLAGARQALLLEELLRCDANLFGKQV